VMMISKEAQFSLCLILTYSEASRYQFLVHRLPTCTCSSALSKIRKKRAWKSISNNKVHQESLACVGHSLEVDEETAKKAEAFICSLYTISNRIQPLLMRLVIFCSAKKPRTTYCCLQLLTVFYGTLKGQTAKHTCGERP